MKPIRLSGHARDQLHRRGCSEQEVVEAISSSPWEPANQGRFECSKNFPYHNEWNGKTYDIKQVRPIFVDEANEVVVITVYTYFF